MEQALIRQQRFRDRLYLAIGASCGYRCQELLSLKIGQLVTPNGEVAREVTVARRDLKNGRGKYAKGVRSRRVPLNEHARGAIADYLAALRIHPTPDTYVFKSAKGQNEALRRCQAHKIVKSAARAAGIDGARIGVHSLRKCFARAVHATGGNDLLKTMRILGHASPMTTISYLENSSDELDELVLSISPHALRGAASQPLHGASPLGESLPAQGLKSI